jgi:hypothetical protein
MTGSWIRSLTAFLKNFEQYASAANEEILSAAPRVEVIAE